MAETDFSELTGMTPRRLESLADAIFAFSMTLLALSINIPQAENLGNVMDFFGSQSQNFLNFIVGFLLLAFFWISLSQQFHHFGKTDSVSVMLTIAILLFVVMTPFSTSMMNDFTSSKIAEAFFSGNLLALSLLLTVNWMYAVRKGLLKAGHEKAHIQRATSKGKLMPLIPLAGVVLAFVVPGWSTMVYLAIPVLMLTSARSKQGAA